jgi:hypothetical protein
MPVAAATQYTTTSAYPSAGTDIPARIEARQKLHRAQEHAETPAQGGAGKRTTAPIRSHRILGEANETFALIGAGVAAVALSGSVAASAADLGGGLRTLALAALLALAGVTIGQLLGRADRRAAAKAACMLMFRVADELAQYRAFTRLLRDQGNRIVETTSEAATAIVAGLNEMDAAVDGMRVLVERGAADESPELSSLVEAAGAPVLGMLGQLQFQDVTQQQIGFLSRLSLILDDRMVQLSRQLGDRRAADRIGKFKEMFDHALSECVMDSQRNDHHAASGLAVREDTCPTLELF